MLRFARREARQLIQKLRPQPPEFSRCRRETSTKACRLAARVFYFVMRQPLERPQNFTGQLLVAHPSMLDPNFRRSVLFISSHEADEGAIGVIINRPLDKHVSELLLEPAPGALANVPVFL